MSLYFTKILGCASVLAIMAVTPVLADTVRAGQQAQDQAQPGSVEAKANPRGVEVTKDDIKQGLDNTKDSISKTTHKVANAVDEKYHDVKAVVLGKDQQGTTFDHTTFQTSYSAKAIIGQSIKDTQGKNVAKIHDIILDKDGNAKSIIVQDGGFFGVGGKMAALNYASVVKSSEDAEILMPLSKDTVKNVAEFSYKPTETAGVNVLPADGVSLKEVLASSILTPDSKKLASVDNVIMSKGQATKLIVGFDKTLGLGGEKAALDFSDAKLTREEGGKVTLQLSAAQSSSFDNYKKSVSKTN
ncbi:MAG: photosystem reaction center subunit [Micavibrio sp.]|nr:photosystem reaction center subunit [Micavibrio sp.]